MIPIAESPALKSWIMVWLVLIVIGLVCVSLIAVRYWEFRHSEEGTISGSLCQLLLWFAAGQC